MFEMTTEAGAHLAGLLREREVPETSAARIFAGNNGVSIQVDDVRPGDLRFSYGDRVVLVLAPTESEALGGLKLTRDENEAGQPRLVLRPQSDAW